MVSRIQLPVRRGLTLVELLVVIGIIVVLLAVAIPVMRLNFEDRHVREAARGVNAFIAAAQGRAAENNRPVGVWLERDPNNNGQCIRLYMADVPPPFTGDFAGARATIEPQNNGNLHVWFRDGFSTGVAPLVSVGDVIRFDYKGPYYPILRVFHNPNAGVGLKTQLWIGIPPGEVPPAAIGVRVPYQILRAPVKSNVSPIELSGTSAIDLNVSGPGLSTQAPRPPWPPAGPPPEWALESWQIPPSPPQQQSLGPILFAPVRGMPADPDNDPPPDLTPVVIVFSPSGRVDHLRVQGQIIVPQDTVHLLLGSSENVGRADPTGNLADDALTNVWVSIGVQTGSVTTAEVAKVTATNVPFAVQVHSSRRIANKKHQMGGG